MTKETKELIKCLLGLLFLPITGFHYLIKECKNDNYECFFSEWFAYVLMVIAWCGCIAIISLIICNFSATIIPVSITVGVIFVFFILPIIIHKLINKNDSTSSKED